MDEITCCCCIPAYNGKILLLFLSAVSLIGWAFLALAGAASGDLPIIGTAVIVGGCVAA